MNRNKNKIEQAILYASSSNQIEDNKPTLEDLEIIKQALEASKKDESFIYSVVKKIKEHEEKCQRTKK